MGRGSSPRGREDDGSGSKSIDELATLAAELRHIFEGGGGEPCARFERENEVRKEGGDGGNRLPLKPRWRERGWG
jgi:hypothetical protein